MDAYRFGEMPILLDFGKFDLKSFYGGTPSLSSDSNVGVLPKISDSAATSVDSSHNDLAQAKLDDPADIECYCLNRLSEIRQINMCSHTPSAFSCLMSYVGFLSELAYGLKDERGNLIGETKRYENYCNQYMGHLWCWLKAESKKVKDLSPSRNSWGLTLYSLIRCGLVHNMNLTGRRSQDQIQIYLTHDRLTGKDYKCVDFGTLEALNPVVKDDESISIVINVFDLCDAVQHSIVKMFHDKKVRDKSVEVMREYPVIQKVL